MKQAINKYFCADCCERDSPYALLAMQVLGGSKWSCSFQALYVDMWFREWFSTLNDKDLMQAGWMVFLHQECSIYIILHKIAQVGVRCKPWPFTSAIKGLQPRNKAFCSNPHKQPLLTSAEVSGDLQLEGLSALAQEICTIGIWRWIWYQHSSLTDHK